MKKEIAIGLSLMSLSTHALVASNESLNQQKQSCMDAFPGCFFTSTISLPTIIVSDQLIDLNAEEVFLRVHAEAIGDLDPVMTQILSETYQIDPKLIMSEVRFLETIHQRSIPQVINNLTK